MLTPFDDYPVHQTPEPIAIPSTGDRNAYDRYFFNGYDTAGELFFAAALGVYPNREVMDAAFSVVRGGVQTSVHASRRAPRDRTQTTVGPVSVEVLEPLRRHRVRVAANESGVECDLVLTARTDAIEEPRFTLKRGTRTVMDYTRLTQFGSWEGTLTVDGERLDIGGDVLGSRDRSWGIRGVGERETGAPARELPQFFWLWAPLNFDDGAVHFDVQEDAAGRQWHANGERWPLLGQGEGERMVAVDHRITWRPGTRRATAAELSLTPLGGDPLTVELEPLLDFQMLGIGYLHPEWGHGVWKGEEAVGVESWRLDELDPMAPHHLHVQQLCRARMGDRTGTGVLEQLVIGPHAPSGFNELLDGAT